MVRVVCLEVIESERFVEAKRSLLYFSAPRLLSYWFLIGVDLEVNANLLLCSAAPFLFQSAFH